jgi:hypothetical protein
MYTVVQNNIIHTLYDKYGKSDGLPVLSQPCRAMDRGVNMLLFELS